MGSEGNWHRAFPLDALALNESRAVVLEGVSVLVVRVDTDEVQAVHNECSHHHAPLDSSPIKNGQVICRFHGWRFQLEDGVCTFGGANIRSFQTEVRGGVIWIEIAPVLHLLP